MSDSIGEYIKLRLRSKNKTNKDAAACIGLSVSAFDKVLTVDDIYTSRLVKLSGLLQENLLEFYNTYEPIKTILEAEANARKETLQTLTDKLDLMKELIDSKEELLENQRKYISELESRLGDKKT